jgi:hypothetical protein
MNFSRLFTSVYAKFPSQQPGSARNATPSHPAIRQDPLSGEHAPPAAWLIELLRQRIGTHNA